MRRVHAMKHRSTQRRRLFAGRVQIAYNREQRLIRLEEGRIKKRRLFAGKVGVAYNRELRMQRLAQGRGPLRHEFSHHLPGEFSGYVKDPAIRRTPRRSRATGKKRRMSARQERFLHSLR